jgi:hypothetical protein
MAASRNQIMWSLAITAPNREFVVSRALERWAFQHHVFKIRRRIVHRGAAADRLYPAFPSYIFLVTNGYWEALREVFGILEFVKQGERVAELPAATINSLLRVAGADDVLPVAAPPARFQTGDRVAIRGMSLLAGQCATFQHQLTEDQSIVLIDWMGRWVPIAIDERDLCADQQAKPHARRRNRKRQYRRVESRASSSRAAATAFG